MFYLEKTFEGWAGYHNGIQCTDFFLGKKYAQEALDECEKTFKEEFDKRKAG